VLFAVHWTDKSCSLTAVAIFHPCADADASSQKHHSVIRHLNDSDRDVHLLDRHPEVIKLFMKYNIAIASSAPVERLYSTGALVLSKRRNRLSDSLFETAVKSE